METLSEKLKHLRESKGLSLRKLGEILNIHFSTLGSYEQGRRNPDLKTLRQLAEFYGVTTDYLLGIVDSPTSKLKGEVTSHIPANQRRVPVLGRVAAGIGIPAQEDIIGYITLDLDDFADFGLQVKGNSMFPLLHDGDIVYVKKQPIANNGQVTVVRINGDDGVIKHFHKNRDAVILTSENPEFTPIRIPKEKWTQECEIIGVVTGYKRKI